jgi:AraC family transcriptional regulator
MTIEKSIGGFISNYRCRSYPWRSCHSIADRKMPEPQPLTVDFTKEEDVRQILPRPARRSSEDLGWQNIYIQQHHQPAWETPESAHIKHMILVHSDEVATQAERWFDGHREREQIEGENNIIIVPANVLHKANWNRDSTFSLLFIEPDLLDRVAYESVKANRIRLMPQRTMSDPTIDRIARLLSAELETHLFASSLFADSLTIALAIHLLRHYTDLPQPLREDRQGLSRQKLQQAIDYINVRSTRWGTVCKNL